MKIVIRVIQVLTAFVLIFFSIGMLKESFSYQTKITVAAPVKEAYAIFTDPALADQWITGLVGIERIKGDPLTENSRWKIIIEQDGNRFEMVETVTHIIPNKLFAFNLENEMMTVEVNISFEYESGETTLYADNLVRGKGILWRSVLPLMKTSMQEQTQRDYNKLAKVIMENNGL